MDGNGIARNGVPVNNDNGSPANRRMIPAPGVAPQAPAPLVRPPRVIPQVPVDAALPADAIHHGAAAQRQGARRALLGEFNRAAGEPQGPRTPDPVAEERPPVTNSPESAQPAPKQEQGESSAKRRLFT